MLPKVNCVWLLILVVDKVRSLDTLYLAMVIGAPNQIMGLFCHCSKSIAVLGKVGLLSDGCGYLYPRGMGSSLILPTARDFQWIAVQEQVGELAMDVRSGWFGQDICRIDRTWDVDKDHGSRGNGLPDLVEGYRVVLLLQC